MRLVCCSSLVRAAATHHGWSWESRGGKGYRSGTHEVPAGLCEKGSGCGESGCLGSTWEDPLQVQRVAVAGGGETGASARKSACTSVRFCRSEARRYL